MISGMRQVSFATAMRSNKYQGRLTQTLLQKSQIKIVIVTTGLFHSFKRMLIWEDHWQVQWFLGNHCKFQWFWSNHCKFSMVFEETITIECFLAVWPLPTMVFQWFLIVLPSLSMVFDGFGPLVKRCDGFDGSLWSMRIPASINLDTCQQNSFDTWQHSWSRPEQTSDPGEANL